ncbi:MAG TPA: TlpA disulfide reductase family protein [Actinomycetaceae bacterium]|nr:TlpA disulfide reductase family protein [Actinomycetaceae bacterium]
MRARRPRPGVRRIAALMTGAALAAGLAGCASIGRPESAPGAGYQAGDGSFATWDRDERGAPVEVVGESYEGEGIDVADWRGDVVVMNFWYAACPPCRVEAPELVAIAEDYPEIHMLGVNPRDDAGAAQAFERTFSIPYPSLWDLDATAVAAMQGLVPLQAMPTTIVLDREGRVASRILGQADPGILRGLIDDALAEE